MKHQVAALFLLVGFMLSADSDKYVIADKSKRVGRFSYEDSFDEKLVETVLKNSPSVVKKNIKRLLYAEPGEDNVPQRLLLLGGISNASTTAVAKAIALRCGYEYYLIEASALLREYREGRQALLTEVRSVIKQGKPIAIIITELPEMADYSGLLASTLWLLIDQCEKYPDVLVIATSAFQQGELSEVVKDRFGEDIISVGVDTEKSIKNIIKPKTSWLKRNNIILALLFGFICCAVVVYEATHIVLAIEQLISEDKHMIAQLKLVNGECKNELDKQRKKINHIYDWVNCMHSKGCKQ